MLFFLFLINFTLYNRVIVIDYMYVVQIHSFSSSWMINDLKGWEGGSKYYIVETGTPL